MKADKVLERIDGFAPYLLPDVQTYNMLVDAKILQDPSEAGRFAESILERMYQESHVNPSVLPNVVSYKCIITAWAKSGVPDAGEKAETAFVQTQLLLAQ